MSFGLKLFDILTANATAAKSYINRMLAKKQDKLTFDSAPTAGSSNPVTSDGIRKAIDTATPNVDFSNYPTKDGTGATGTWPISISGAATKASQDSNGRVIADEYWHNASFLSDVDLDTVKKQGVYKQSANVNSTAAHHYPVTLAGSLLVVESQADGFGACTQIYYTYQDNRVFQRSYSMSGKVWSSWREYLFTDSSVANATKATQDANGAVIADTYLKKSGGTMSGALNFANGTKNIVGDDVAMGDFNKDGSLGIQGQNGQTSITLLKNGESWSSSSESAVITYNSDTKSLDFKFQ